MTEFNEAVVILSKCCKHHKTFGIRTEKKSVDNWTFTWAFPVTDDSAKREGYDKTIIKGYFHYDVDFPGCPFCEASNLAICSCGRMNCIANRKRTFTCEWCGAHVTLGSYYGTASVSAGMDL